MNDAGYAIIGLGIAAAGATIGKAALDEFLSPHKAADRAAERAAIKARTNPVDKVVGSIAMAITAGSIAMKLYSWYATGKAPSPGELVG